MKKKVSMVTGITGQDGSYLSELLLERGHHVIGMYRRQSNPNWSNIEPIMDKIELVCGDLTDMPSLYHIINKHKPDNIFNLGAMSFVPESWNQPLLTTDINGCGVLRLLECIRQIDPSIRFYQASSSELMGKIQAPIQNENTPFYPRSPYGCFPIGTRIECLIKKRHKVKNKETKIVENKMIDFPGGKKIENIKIGDKVLSYNLISGKKEYKKVINLFSRKANELYVIKLSNGNILKCTAEHPIFVHNKGWIQAKDLNTNDEIIQYIYSGLNRRIDAIKRIGKTIIERFGEDKAIKIIKKIIDGNKKYAKNRRELNQKNIKKVNIIDGDNYIHKERKKNAWHLSEHTKNKMKGRIPWNKGLTKNSDERIKNMGEKISQIGFSKYKNIKIKISNTLKERWKEQKYREIQLRAQQKSPNKMENKIQDILNLDCENQFRYVGNRALFLGNPPKNPDWIHLTKNKVIEFFGRHWHDAVEEKELKEHYAKIGYECLVIWEEELKDLNYLSSKIKNFVYNKKTEVIKVVSILKEKYYGMVFNLEVEENNNYFAYGILVHNCAKLFGYWATKNYRESYNLFACNGILYNHESKKRGLQFVTRKITNSVAKIYLGKQDKLILGNLDAKRDWGHSKDYCLAMLLMLEQEKPDDYVVSSGECHSVRDFVDLSFKRVGWDVDWRGSGVNEKGYYKDKVVVEVSPQFFRPAEVDVLLGDSSKARKVLGWKPNYSFNDLVNEMVDYDLLLEDKK